MGSAIYGSHQPLSAKFKNSAQEPRANNYNWTARACLFMFWFLDAGMTNPSTRCGGRRPKTAKARSRGRLGTGRQRVLWKNNVGAQLDDGRDGRPTPAGWLQGRDGGTAQQAVRVARAPGQQGRGRHE